MKAIDQNVNMEKIERHNFAHMNIKCIVLFI
jgi:hypothetical protein